ncbi:unnamed protein product [Alopecurus aequalis]
MAAVAAGALAVVLLAAVGSALANQTPDAAALLALKSGLQDPGGNLQSWDPDLVDPCTWFHITCDGNNRVIRVDLQRMDLSGPLSPELSKLDQLQYMELYGNNFHGTIPEEFGDLKNLMGLDLYNNDISGHIPASLGKLASLKFLRMDHNHLTGPIPRELAGLPQLAQVDLSNNDLCGTIPKFQDGVQSNFANNPRLRGPGQQQDDANC